MKRTFDYEPFIREFVRCLQQEGLLDAMLEQQNRGGAAAKSAKPNAKAKGKGKQKAAKDEKPAPPTPRGPPPVSVAAIVGGMSPQKQKRILERGVDILVATPGRLWDIIETVRLHP